ncbi:hypothetical protein B0H17DRAFT_1125770 [Mycena rosella]|uniref:Uncharacterized protein n=1 Tax=Mycena rosella TaxID=1033263 RepID=A0AAD7GWY4_MYCRO|nr:hypothetical protein B0H17DRAFT_1125770 [Mycena rosella]
MFLGGNTFLSGTNVAYIYINSANNVFHADLSGMLASGVIRCDSQTSTVTAKLFGAGFTYSSFSEAPLYNATQGGESLLDPLFALFDYFSTHSASFNNNVEYLATVVRALGFTGAGHGDGSQTYAQPSGDGQRSLARRLCRGHRAPFADERHVVSCGSERSGGGLLLLISITARSLQPTFEGSFDSYITAKSVQEKPGVMHNSNGELAEYMKLREPFGTVGREDLWGPKGTIVD